MAKPKKTASRHSAGGSDATANDARVSFDLIKGALFRGVHADGVWGGVTPQGLLSFTFFSERFPIPQQLTHCLNPDGTLGQEITEARVTRSAIVRDAEVCVYMTLPVAMAFRALLDQTIKNMGKGAEEGD